MGASGNSCNGRGPCDVDTGKCGCPVVKEGCTSCGANECGDRAKCGAPYFGQSCEFERCPNDCSTRGACNNQDGSCACTDDEAGNPYFGPSCEFNLQWSFNSQSKGGSIYCWFQAQRGPSTQEH